MPTDPMPALPDPRAPLPLPEQHPTPCADDPDGAYKIPDPFLRTANTATRECIEGCGLAADPGDVYCAACRSAIIRTIEIRDDSFADDTWQDRTHADDKADALAEMDAHAVSVRERAEQRRIDRRTGAADRRSTSAAGDRLRLRAATFRALADTNADASQDAASDYMSGYGEGAANAWNAAADMIEQLAAEEDAR